MSVKEGTNARPGTGDPRLALVGAAVALAAVLVLAAGCAPNVAFVYKPDASAVGGEKVPAKVVVLAFANGTEDFRQRGSMLTGGHVNMARADYPGMMSGLTPQQMARFFADDLASSGAFRSVRFAFDVSEAAADEVIVEGVVLAANLAIFGTDASRFAVRLKARTRKDGEAFWEREVSREASLGSGYGVGCGLSVRCSLDKCHAHHNRMLQGIFLEARRDLVAALGRGGDLGNAGKAPPGKDGSRSIDDLIGSIVEEK